MTGDKHWDKYYGTGGQVAAPLAPSQFAAFVLAEIRAPETRLVDFGCGNGRDALFFAHHGASVIGVDASEVAIDSCRQRAPENAIFLCHSVDDPVLPGLVQDALNEIAPNRETVLYARFFLHAITRELQNAFLAACRAILGNQGRCFFEFRTDRDQFQTKITPSHFRRFIPPLEFLGDARAAGFDVAYFVEGFGFAKYRQDDAHVARFVLEAR